VSPFRGVIVEPHWRGRGAFLNSAVRSPGSHRGCDGDFPLRNECCWYLPCDLQQVSEVVVVNLAHCRQVLGEDIRVPGYKAQASGPQRRGRKKRLETESEVPPRTKGSSGTSGSWGVGNREDSPCHPFNQKREYQDRQTPIWQSTPAPTGRRLALPSRLNGSEKGRRKASRTRRASGSRWTQPSTWKSSSWSTFWSATYFAITSSVRFPELQQEPTDVAPKNCFFRCGNSAAGGGRSDPSAIASGG
jgi:hypothetical protein